MGSKRLGWALVPVSVATVLSIAVASAASTKAVPDLAYAHAQVVKYRQVPKFVPPGPAFNAKKGAGKTIFTIPITSAVPFVDQTDAAMAAIAKKQGYKYIEFRNQGQPSQWVQGMEQAIAQKVDLIILQTAPPPQLLGPQLAQAKKAGIPVLLTHIIDNSGSCPASVTACVKAPFNLAARLEADWIIDDSKGKADVLFIISREILPTAGIVKSALAEFKTRCGPGCKVKVVNVPLVDWATKIGTETQAALRADPQINYVLNNYDSMNFYSVPAVVAAGKAAQVKNVGYNGTSGVLKLLAQRQVVAMDVGESLDWLAYANMDQAFRILSGAPLVKSGLENTPVRIFDATNIREAGTPPSQHKGYGNGFRVGYQKLWSGK